MNHDAEIASDPEILMFGDEAAKDGRNTDPWIRKIEIWNKVHLIYSLARVQEYLFLVTL